RPRATAGRRRLPGRARHVSVTGSPPMAGPPSVFPAGGAGGPRLTAPDPQLRPRARSLIVAALLLAAPFLPGCSLQRLAAGSVANSLTRGPDVFGTDDDPE